MSALVRLAAWWPWSPAVPAALDRSLGYLGAPTDGETVLRAGYTTAVLLGVAAMALTTALPGVSPGTGVPVAVVLATGAVLAVRRGPVGLAAMRRTTALGETTGLVGRAVLRLRVEPTVERAAHFAARTGTGPLARSLDDHVRRTGGSAESGFAGFVAEWREWFPALDRAVSLLEASAAAPADERGRTLDRAMQAVLDGTHDRMARFASEVRGPVTGVYAFGVLLPLALVGVLPAARVAGLSVSVAQVALVYDFVLPLSLLGAGGWILARRPVAFPPPRVERAHPDVPSQRWPALLAGVTGGGVGWVAGTTLVADWTGPVAAVGGGVGLGLVVHYRPVKAVRDRVRAVEDGLDDALYLVGRRVTEGVAVETALARAADEVTGATGDVLADAVGVQRRLRVGVDESFLGEYGALSTLPSPRARSTAALLALAAGEGRPAGRALVALAEQLGDLRRVEREARRELASVTGTLANTAALFGPLVAGSTVALAARMGRTATSLGRDSMATALPVDALGAVMGVYVLLLAVVLTALSTGLDRGLDPALVGYRVGLALLSATTTYLAAVAGAGLLV